ncbi:MAG: response regulator [Arenimonas sp.]|uniref:response regulator n=1 Tax=Arenimonas sp. TaxID=1872635 RepID=UPI0025BEC610|nr:response regulator [Arenimonas sp.]MBW8367865.1 response regulator [Arenimonas sp.]
MRAVSERELLSARILVVDDGAENVALVEELLAREGFDQVLGTTQPERCLELVQAFEPDLVLLDLWMPGVDGFGLLAQLTAPRPGAWPLPVIVLTADATRRTRHRALGLGARDFVTKPFDPLEVLLRVWNHLEVALLLRRLQALGGATGLPSRPAGDEPPA